MTKIALVVFYVGFVGIIVEGCLIVSAPPSHGLDLVIKFTSLLLVLGAVLCWLCGWRRFANERVALGVAAIIRFVVYVWFAPFTLPFKHIDLP